MIVGVMDSGKGGLTTLSRLMQVCGGEYVFVRDKLGPYGDKDDGFVLSRTLKACALLKDCGAEIIVLACNTATNVAIHKLRENDRCFNYIGIEPAVKPALGSCNRVAVALTPTAARQEKFKRLICQRRDKVKLITNGSLAGQIEKFYFDKEALRELAVSLYAECDGCDGLVLGCTHYIFLREYLLELDPRLKIFDGNDGVARRLLRFTGHMGVASVRFEQID
ncbi:MAG: aspartate/glutamate racemase family protein [Clostridiales bacterium]|nr:aspartate/glutamate racemase family protein [Clostridiales bacterium]